MGKQWWWQPLLISMLRQCACPYIAASEAAAVAHAANAAVGGIDATRATMALAAHVAAATAARDRAGDDLHPSAADVVDALTPHRVAAACVRLRGQRCRVEVLQLWRRAACPRVPWSSRLLSRRGRMCDCRLSLRSCPSFLDC